MTELPTADPSLRLRHLGGAGVLEVRGTVDGERIACLEAVLEAVDECEPVLVVDLSQARSEERRLVRMLCRWQQRRRALGRVGDLRGLHAAVLPALDEVGLVEVFAVYRSVCQERDATTRAGA